MRRPTWPPRNLWRTINEFLVGPEHLDFFADPDRAGDCPGRRQYRVYLDLVRQAARRPAEEGPPDRPGPGADHPRPAAALDLVGHRADRPALHYPGPGNLRPRPDPADRRSVPAW